ncbi:sensor histidine kinase/response regulator, putative [Talaromyces stipitatus ATCC 10500]|uniref:histidine kinase n=1 Tax=Talaromyces stipitatus (strain ATCC 10500 / CBS 375.48 / QM 6759 / NRRL 1006) TaxID=441959 RepID=B8MMI8_TALSN|nr:sensor histidine kinase/response regulator, putative [Talaromyces stipitatus ATCC 10500]EED13742.1 sensor histidine kinase/response regulator, putative [Talaromyces stipitatus ATCC 10500]
MAPTHEALVAHRDDRRFRELYRYFQPANPAALLYQLQNDLSNSREPSADSDDVPTVERNVGNPLAVSLMPPQEDLRSPNTILTSFAQLAAHKLNVERAIICVLGRDSEYILAEAPRVEQTSAQSLWIGYGSDGRFGPTLNLNTVALPASTKTDYQFQIVNDLSADERYADLPFVANEPHFRFYAGTPLTTENNINIGVLFVLDPEPRPNGLSDHEKESLGSLSSMSMDFLRVSRQAAEGRRAARLSRGLSCFVEGSSSFVDGLGSLPSGSHSGSHSGSQHGSAISPISARSSASPPAVGSPTTRSRRSRGSRGSSVDVRPSRSPGPSSSEGKAETGTSSDVTTPLPDWLIAGTKSSKARLADEMHNNHWTFRRAANLIRESLELTGDGGVIFLENSTMPLDVDNGRVEYFEDADSPVSVLGVSTNEEPFAPEPGSNATCAAANCDRRFLQNVLRRYPKGKVWTFHQDRTLFASSDDDEKSPNSPVSAVRTPDAPPGTSKKWRASEATQLAKYFPNASQVLFVPLWNAATSQWYAGCFCWSCTETQVFSPTVELASIMGFGYSIMAELSRLESIIADRQKGDFIGSISHELRSPLHGILAAAEFMDGTYMNEFQKSLLETINACGRTLLDTMNQVLDFSKIVSLEKSWRQVKKARRDPKDDVVDNVKGIDSMAALLDTHTCEDICLLTEEVVEGVCLGHSYGRSASGSTGVSRAPSMPSGTGSSSLSTPDSETAGEIRPEVEVIVDMKEGNWVYKTQPGALRRIIMNIFGNAMKYTDTGHIIVRLESVKSEESSAKSKVRNDSDELVVLTVSDTGKGISEEFLRARLYTPFAQEDTLAVGTGLGLSIVRSIVKSLGGHIGIRSRPGEGTSVKVTLPLPRPGPEDGTSPVARPHQSVPGQELHIIRERFSGKKVAIIGYDPESTAPSTMSSLAKYVTNWCGLTVVPWFACADSADLVLATDRGVNEELKVQQTVKARAMVVICSTTVDYDTYRSAWSKLTSVVEFLYRPCGPYKLARSLLRCFKQAAALPPAEYANTLHPGLVDRTRVPIPDTDHTRSTGDLNNNPGPSLVDLRAHSEPRLEPAQPVMLSPTIELPEIMDEGIHNRRSAPAVPTLERVQGELMPTLPEDRALTLSPATPVNVLVVDDNHINLRLLLTYLSRRNIANLDSAENGKMAVDAVEKRSEGYDIIFMDISMPVMNGFEATRAIRSLENERDEKRPATIIALTGLSSARDETEAMTSGVDLFLTKPVSLKEVSRLLDEWQPKQIDN